MSRFSFDPAMEALAGRLRREEPLLWCNPAYLPYAEAKGDNPLTADDIAGAEARLARFAPLLAELFTDTRPADGLIESPLRAIPQMQGWMEAAGLPKTGPLLLKMDSHLPVAGSVKARGGVYEVLAHAERLALANGLWAEGESPLKLLAPEARALFGRHSLQAASTGNLGISIGTAGAALGFRVTIHMSADARQWKKDLLRQKGVTVLEYSQDYSGAITQARAAAEADPASHFVDDEHSTDLFLGYAVAARRLEKQLAEMDIKVDAEHPLLVYLPCGVGGAPGGVNFGLKEVYGDAVHCFYAEPTGAPAMLLGLASGLNEGIAVQDLGLTGKTEADGLAVGRPSGFVGKAMGRAVAGCYTMEDGEMAGFQRALYRSEGIFVEPSACAAFGGPAALLGPEAVGFRAAHAPGDDALKNATHLLWATGGNLVPREVRAAFLAEG